MSSSARRLILIAGLSSVALGSLRAQADTSARISGTALSAYNGKPLAGVRIAVPAAQKLVVTDSSGFFAVSGLAAGSQTLRISYDGRDSEEYEFALRRARTLRLAVVIDVDALQMAPLVVEARLPDIWRDLAGFYERRRQYGGFARFITREDIDRQRPGALSTLLKGDGIFTWCVYTCLPTRFSHGRICSVPVSVNGLPIWERELDKIPIDNIAAVEIYRDPANSGPFGLPLMGQYGFEGKDLIQGRGNCGSVGIWTR
jgi:hypothetical protein